MSIDDNIDEAAVIAKIDEQIANNPILLYMKGTPSEPQCGFSARAAKLLAACGAKFASVNILAEQDIRRVLPKHKNWPTFPQLYVNGKLQGGSDIMQEMYEAGELQKLVGKKAESSE